MNRFASLRAVVAGVALIWPFHARGQTPQERANASVDTTHQHGQLLAVRHEFAVEGALSYYTPEPGQYQLYRDIDVTVADVALTAYLPAGWEFLADAFLLRAQGKTAEQSFTPNPPQFGSDALGAGVGPGVRWNFLEGRRARIFVDARGDLMLADHPFPTGGSSYDFLLRAGVGASFRISNSYWVESTFGMGHISNGRGLVADNPTWQGYGFSVAIRGALRAASDPSDPSADSSSTERAQSAWTTSVESYDLVSVLSPKTNLQGDRWGLRISRSWLFPSRWELQVGGAVEPWGSAAGVGPLIRWNVVAERSWHVFADAGFDALMTGDPAYILPVPWSTSAYHLLVRAGGGTSVHVWGAYWLEPSARWVQFTSGIGPTGNAYRPWSGLALSVGLRRGGA